MLKVINYILVFFNYQIIWNKIKNFFFKKKHLSYVCITCKRKYESQYEANVCRDWDKIIYGPQYIPEEDCPNNKLPDECD